MFTDNDRSGDSAGSALIPVSRGGGSGGRPTPDSGLRGVGEPAHLGREGGPEGDKRTHLPEEAGQDLDGVNPQEQTWVSSVQ